MQSYKKLDRSGLENNGKLWNGILPMRNLTDLTIFSNPSSKKKIFNVNILGVWQKNILSKPW